MKIFVQGRKRGYIVLYPFPTPDEFYNFATDIQSINAQNQPYFYGKFLYSIAFSRGGRIFTKYVLGYDVQRSNLGNISFSVFVPDNKTLSGPAVIELLDALSEKYFNTYAPNFFINDNQENWGILSSIADQYDAKLISLDQLDIEHIEKGTQDAAYIYYTSHGQLADLFDEPYQKAYTPYTQVFLIDASLKGKPENPLNALKNSQDADLSERIDLENKKFRLILNPSAMATVERIDGGKTLYSNDRFFRKEELCIKWSKQHHQSFEKRGTIDDLKDYLEINEMSNTATVKPVVLQIISKDIQPQFLLNGNPVEVENIKCLNNQGEEVALKDGKLHFEGAQVAQNWTITATKSPYISIDETFVPENSPIVLHLRAIEKKEISFRFEDSETGERIHSVEISINESYGTRSLKYGSILFSNEELDKECLLRFSAQGYNVVDAYSLTPREVGQTITVKLNRKPESRKNVQESEIDDKKSLAKKSWFLRNMLALILAALLIISLTINILQFHYANKHFKKTTSVRVDKSNIVTIPVEEDPGLFEKLFGGRKK